MAFQLGLTSALAAVAVAASSPAWAANKALELKTVEGVSNVRVAVNFKKNGQTCSPAVLSALKKRALEVAHLYIAPRIEQLRANAGTDASGKNEFFLVSYTALCDKIGGVAFADATEDPVDHVHQYDPGTEAWECWGLDGASCMETE